MKKFILKYSEILFFLFVPLGICTWLWLKSDPAPFGTPLNELSDQCWGIYIEMARQWKSGDFSFWTRSIGGGYCLYTSGFFPIGIPWNVIAKVVSFDHFYLFKMIEPYFISLATMAFFLRRGLKLSYALSAFGTLAYSGFVFTRYVGIIHMPFFLWACALFPLILFIYQRLFKKHIYFRSVVMGALMALVFLGGGAGQYAQMIIWGLILLVVDALVFGKEKSWVRKGILAITSCGLFVFFAFVLVGAQILPMAVYTLTESSRTLGEYPINNFPFFRNDYKGMVSISKILEISIWTDGDHGVRAFWALMIFAFGQLIVQWNLFRRWCVAHKALMSVGLTTILFFLLPPVAEILAGISPLFARLFNPLRMFTFGYCGFMIDMMFVIVLAVLLDLKLFSNDQKSTRQPWKEFVTLLFLILAMVYLFLPLWLKELFPQVAVAYVHIHWVERYLAMLCLLILTFPIKKWKTWSTVILALALFSISLKLVQTSYAWGEKGRQTALAEYALDTPEHEFYRTMKGHYYLPFVHPDGTPYRHVSMTHNYDLLYGVDGLQGFLNIPPKRLSNFINAYHNRIYWTKNMPAYKFSWRSTPASLTTHFPVEFTSIGKGMVLPWPGFSKAVDGRNFDMWVRDEPVSLVRFAKEIKVVSYRELIDSFDQPYQAMIYMTPEDAKRYAVPALENVPLLSDATYQHFRRLTADHWTFEVETSEEVYVVLPEMFHSGWRLTIDDKVQSLFPANSVFMGFLMEKGKHRVELQFRPVLLEAGWFLTLFGCSLLGWILYGNLKKRKKRM